MTRKSLSTLRDQILTDRGLRRVAHAKPAPVSPALPKPNAYTKQMWLVELLLGIKLDDYLFSKPDAALAKELNVNKSTICRWRRRILTGKDR